MLRDAAGSLLGNMVARARFRSARASSVSMVSDAVSVWLTTIPCRKTRSLNWDFPASPNVATFRPMNEIRSPRDPVIERVVTAPRVGSSRPH
jgi:hypothetical protein